VATGAFRAVEAARGQEKSMFSPPFKMNAWRKKGEKAEFAGGACVASRGALINGRHLRGRERGERPSEPCDRARGLASGG